MFLRVLCGKWVWFFPCGPARIVTKLLIYPIGLPSLFIPISKGLSQNIPSRRLRFWFLDHQINRLQITRSPAGERSAPLPCRVSQDPKSRRAHFSFSLALVRVHPRQCAVGFRQR